MRPFFNSNNNKNNNLPPHHQHHLFNCLNHLLLEHHLQHLDIFNWHHHLYKITLISPKQKQQQRYLVILQLKKTVDSKQQGNLQQQIDDPPEPLKLELGDTFGFFLVASTNVL